mmetsp:Transcript_8284/g.22993  ORF Transcript_8284/g.22993 Transcript_8284/m.22993 type:complete len:232 (+) Transcript_8284:2573-3268(+)
MFHLALREQRSSQLRCRLHSCLHILNVGRGFSQQFAHQKALLAFHALLERVSELGLALLQQLFEPRNLLCQVGILRLLSCCTKLLLPLRQEFLAGGHRSLYVLLNLLRLVADFLRVRSRQLVQHDELGSCTFKSVQQRTHGGELVLCTHHFQLAHPSRGTLIELGQLRSDFVDTLLQCQKICCAGSCGTFAELLDSLKTLQHDCPCFVQNLVRVRPRRDARLDKRLCIVHL